MIIERFSSNSFESNSYLIIHNKKCILIDPSIYNKALENYLEEYELEAILLTHGHYDHFLKINEILEKHQCHVYMHKECYKKMNNIYDSFAYAFGCMNPTIIDSSIVKLFTNEKSIKINDLNIMLYYLPGHTNCSIGYLIEDKMFIGDVLFYDSVGRTDLPTGSYPALNESIRRLKNLDNNIHYYPGHDEDFILRDIFKINRFLQ